jgi:hypothetical protein
MSAKSNVGGHREVWREGLEVASAGTDSHKAYENEIALVEAATDWPSRGTRLGQQSPTAPP